MRQMTTFYDEIRELNNAGLRAFVDWENEHLVFSELFCRALREGLGWPAEGFGRLQFEKDEIPEGARPSLTGGFIDAKGYRFGLQFSHGRGYVRAIYACRRRDDGAFDVSLDGEVWRVDQRDMSSIRPVLEHAKEAIRENVLQGSFASLTGFKPKA